MDLMEKIISLCKRRGFVYPSSEIYGGLGSFYDYGHYGVLLRNNIKNLWWHDNVLSRDDILGLDSSLILHPRVWEASGHLSSFTDPLVECTKCHHRFRADDLPANKKNCPDCQGLLSLEKPFNLMFKTHIGPLEDAQSQAYLRPETAQGIFINFKNVLKTFNKKIPFGIAQIGKAFRNEITPKNFIFRMREFEQMEIEFFVEKGEDEKWHQYWLDERIKWYKKLGINSANLQLRQHGKNELSFYSKATFDIEYRFPWGWGEIEGIANRTDFDLKQHQKFSGKDLSYFDSQKGISYLPYTIEPSSGVDRLTLAFLLDAYREEEKRIYLKFHPSLSPVKAAVFPLLANKKELLKFARKIYRNLKDKFNVIYDDRGNIGKRYYSQDEIGTPFCITIDYDTLNDGSVTVRNRDTTKQDRINEDKLLDYLSKKLSGHSS
ncbi:glycine--tRNA ligase [Candidatus Gottesmanbacteria bacterium RBG_16_37_8]|uniref:Glycine--tRNA ligase n=1 Tax=Candidatus Gottesmanbacteria bacterium RBG_16_37_8 TaxID=1798371 RepID=A0A1F5YT03_9BACT|nr:MAG: glycine--tRNA ligase [Candidatus Gottesmanbacteria bacterium RBG_16_37_8]